MLSGIAFSQNPISKTVGEFDTLKAYDLINIELISSDDNRVEISGKNASDVVVVNSNGKLKIRMNIDEIFDGDDTFIKLYYTSFDVIDANEGAYVYSKETIEQYEVELKTQEGGKIKLPLNVKTADFKAVTGGILELRGSVNNQDVSISTGGIFKGEELQSVTTQIAIRAGGQAWIQATELADIKIRAGGDVFVYGNPTKINEDRALGGRIKRMQ
ncbi:MAG: DUF2807 domain-containing protein [Flavobacteriaceae bacterium]|nr:DUF2807 domain-containing protein [Bacteroidia bacterium]NNF75142.1 DUF2807 domain-containing protein [Flavobacteriaceae bacterium]NNK72158.1 DUF2807 domain-containing protein [Flavobacteriaceae bacterium]